MMDRIAKRLRERGVAFRPARVARKIRREIRDVGVRIAAVRVEKLVNVLESGLSIGTELQGVGSVKSSCSYPQIGTGSR